MTKENEEKKKQKNFRYVIYFCGCRLDNILVYPPICVIHNEGIKMTGPMLPHGESKWVDPRYVC